MVCLFAAPKRHLVPSDLSSRKYNCHLSASLTRIFWVKAMTSRTKLGISSRRFLGNEQLQQLSCYCIKLAMTDACAHIFRIELVIQINREMENRSLLISCPVPLILCNVWMIQIIFLDQGNIFCIFSTTLCNRD